MNASETVWSGFGNNAAASCVEKDQKNKKDKNKGLTFLAMTRSQAALKRNLQDLIPKLCLLLNLKTSKAP